VLFVRCPPLRPDLSLVLRVRSLKGFDGITVLLRTYGSSCIHVLDFCSRVPRPTSPSGFCVSTLTPFQARILHVTFTSIHTHATQLHTDKTFPCRIPVTAVFTICDKRSHDSEPWRGSCLVGGLKRVFRDGETRRRKTGSLGCPALITNMPNRGSPPIGPRYRSCPQLQLTIIDCLRPTRGYPITRRPDESQM
jgi:hypothetical protein